MREKHVQDGNEAGNSSLSGCYSLEFSNERELRMLYLNMLKTASDICSVRESCTMGIRQESEAQAMTLQVIRL